MHACVAATLGNCPACISAQRKFPEAIRQQMRPRHLQHMCYACRRDDNICNGCQPMACTIAELLHCTSLHVLKGSVRPAGDISDWTDSRNLAQLSCCNVIMQLWRSSRWDLAKCSAIANAFSLCKLTSSSDYWHTLCTMVPELDQQTKCVQAGPSHLKHSVQSLAGHLQYQATG